MGDKEKRAAVEAALHALAKKGRLTPEEVVSAAKKPSSVLHTYFEWDDGKAAHSWRIEEARRLIRSVPLIIENNEKSITTVYYVRDPRAKEDQGYVSIEQLRREPETAHAMLSYEFERAGAALTRAESLAAALGVEKDVVALNKRLGAVRRKIERKVTAAA